MFTGYLYGEGTAALHSNAYLFALPQMVGGTPPVLLEAMGYGNCVLVSDTPFHMETIGEAGVAFDLRQGDVDLKAKLQWLIENPAVVEDFRRKAVERITERYQWDQVVDAHEQLYARLLGKPSQQTLRPQSGEFALPASKEQS